MSKEKLLKHIIFLMFFMFLANHLISKLHWYYSVGWIDMPMHFLGGFWVSLFFLYVFLYIFYDQNPLFKKYVNVLLCVLIVGLLWEVFEFLVFNNIGRDPFNIVDTSSDIVFDLSGGLCAILYLWKKQERRQLK